MAKRPEPRTVAVLSEHALYRAATANLLRDHGLRVDECASHSQIQAVTRARTLDAVLVDLDHAHSDVQLLVAHVRAVHDGEVIPVGTALRQAAALSHSDETGVETPDADARVLIAAANGKRPRASAELARQLRVWSRLTPRQREVMRWLANGLDNRAIGTHLQTGERAVKLHISALLAAFNLHNRAQLALHALRAGVFPQR